MAMWYSCVARFNDVAASHVYGAEEHVSTSPFAPSTSLESACARGMCARQCECGGRVWRERNQWPPNVMSCTSRSQEMLPPPNSTLIRPYPARYNAF